MKYIVFGVPGVGKTSVMKGVVEKTGINRVHWGDLSKDIAVANNLINDIDELRKLDLESQLKVKEMVVNRILEESSSASGDMVIETHAAIKTPQGFLPGLEMRTIQRLDPDVFIVVEAKPELVFQRRLLDETRTRKDDLTIDEVEESLRVTRQMAMTYSVLASGTVLFVENKEGDLDYAIGRVTELIEKGRVSQNELGAI